MQTQIDSSMDGLKKNRRNMGWILIFIIFGFVLICVDSARKANTFADLPLVDVHVYDVRNMCEMYRRVSRDSIIIVATIDCADKSTWNKSNKFNRLGREVSYRSQEKTIAFYEYQIDQKKVLGSLPVNVVSYQKVSSGQNFKLHYSPKYNRVVGRGYSILDYWPRIAFAGFVTMLVACTYIGLLRAERRCGAY
jgi:hypothetical protein